MIKKIKIASLVNDFGIGGTARQVVTIEKYLNKEFFEHFVISINSNDNERAKFLNNNIFHTFTPEDVIKAVIDNNINILYVHRHGRSQEDHDIIANGLPKNVLLIELNTFSAYDNGCFGQRSDKHIFVSKTNILKYITQNNLKFDFKKHKVVHGLVDEENFTSYQPTEKELYIYKEKHGLDKHFVIGRIARPVLNKWDDRTITFWKNLCKLNTKVKFIVYGVPNERKKYLQDAGIEKNLIILEPTSSDKELSLFYSSIDALVHLSPIGECSCGTIAEAMYFKKPIITTSTPFPRYTLGRSHTKDNGQLEQIKNGLNGYIVNSARCMAKAVNALSVNSDLGIKMGNQNNKEVIDKYSVEVGIKTLEKIFIESFLEKNSKTSDELINYYNSLSFYPNETDIKEWFMEYNNRLSDVFNKECAESLSDKIFCTKLMLKRKFNTLLSKFV